MEKDASGDSGEVKVTVTLVLNASFKPTKNYILHHVTLYILLGGIALVAVVTNLCLLSAIFFNSSLKRLILNQFVSVVSIACILDCCINAPFALYHMKTTESCVENNLCKMNASCLLLFSLIITWGMCGVCIERWFSIFKRSKFKVSAICKRSIAMTVTIFMGMGVIVPIALNFVEVRHFPDRYSCSVVWKKDQLYRVVIIIGFMFPVFLSVITLITSLVKNYRSIRNVSSQNIELSYAELFFEESHLWNEWQTSKFVACITLLYLVLELPFIANQIETTKKPQLINPLGPCNITGAIPHPLTQITQPSERAFTWCKLLFCFMFPLTALVLRKDIRRKVSSLFSFFSANASISRKPTEEGTSPQGENPEDFLVPPVWRRRRLSSVTSLTSPIVFGKSKTDGNQRQFMDLTTGMARWKASYEETKRMALPENILFDDVFEDDDEFTEFSRYEDGTEEEINSSEDFRSVAPVKEVAVQTNDKEFQSLLFATKSLSMCHTLVKTAHKNRNRRLSKSFTSNRKNTATSTKRRNYLTYPKMPASAKKRATIQTNVTTSELLNMLKTYRLNKSVAACQILPRNTGELMGCSLDEGKDVVSL